jgi:two-component system chemotaxis response regulator CheB
VLLVQHISEGFEEGFARWLSDATGQPARLAEDGQRLVPGIWLAPTSKHLTLARGTRLQLPARQPADIHCPSGNPLFESLARHLGPRAAGVLLTGMGDDGAQGLLSLKQAGGATIIQDEQTCSIWGMPKAGKALSAANLELSPSEIARVMTQMTQSNG